MWNVNESLADWNFWILLFEVVSVTVNRGSFGSFASLICTRNEGDKLE